MRRTAIRERSRSGSTPRPEPGGRHGDRSRCATADALPERPAHHALDVATERLVARVLHVGVGDAAVDALVLVEHVGHGDAYLAHLVLQELLAGGEIPQ